MILVCLAISGIPLHAQTRSFYNHNIYSGVTSNHVYKVIVDRYGYVWIATTNGVLRYNGYSFRRFSEEDGLATNDVWNIVEDEYGGIWLGSIANKFGYIANNKFKTVISAASNNPIYPIYLQAVKGGVVFLQTVNQSKGATSGVHSYYCRRNGDTKKVTVMYSAPNVPARTMDKDGNTYLMYKGKIVMSSTWDGKKVNRKIADIDNSKYSYPDSAFCVNMSNNFWFINRHTPADTLYFIGIKNGQLKKMHVPLAKSENIIAIHQINDEQYITTNKWIKVYDSALALKRTIGIKEILPDADTNTASLVWYTENKFWKAFTTTSNKGMYQHFNATALDVSDIIDIGAAEYKGCGANGTQYWVDNARRETIILKGSKVEKRDTRHVLLGLNDVYSYHKDSSIICTMQGVYKINERNWSMVNYYEKLKYLNFSQWVDSTTTDETLIRKTLTASYRQLLYANRDTLYARVMRHSIAKQFWDADTAKDIFVFSEVGDYNTVDTANRLLWSSSGDWIKRYNLQTVRIDSVGISVLARLGISKIRRIKVDPRTGNLFVLCNDKLLLCDIMRHKISQIKFSLNPTTCNMELFGGNLVLLNELGMAIYKVHKSGDVSAPYYILNHKYKYYKYLTGNRFYVGDSIVNFNTDKGLYSLKIPAAYLFGKENYSLSYKLLVSYKDSLFSLNSKDTIAIDQNSGVLSFDVVNPEGVGDVRLQIKVYGEDTAWQLLNGNDWFAAGLKPNAYHKVYVRPMDNGWMGEPIAVVVFIKPYWWQTNMGKGSIGLVALMVIGGVVWLATFVTKRNADRANARKNLENELKNLRTSMELKSIHAQINPHFIFNTLSTGLYFIKKNKMEDAYDHISAFSELLRNYIKSSRDKYIVLNEEIDNLRRYVSLQQSRFDNLHEFDVEIGEGVNVYAEKIPALLLQPLVENAINHGLFHKQTPGRLLLRFEKNIDGDLICIIDDDGVGRQKSKEINAETRHKTQSYGTDLVKELIETFNKYEPIHITISYLDKVAPECGTTVVLTIKQMKNE